MATKPQKAEENKARGRQGKEKGKKKLFPFIIDEHIDGHFISLVFLTDYISPMIFRN